MTIKEETLEGHPYYNPFGCRTWEVGGHKFHIGYARGYNAMGLIGTEHNGIFMLSVTDKSVIMDRHMGQSGCYHENVYHTRRALDEIRRITMLDAAELDEFLSGNERARYSPASLGRARTKASEHDRRIRSDWTEDDFEPSEFMTVRDKKLVMDQMERLLVARIYGSQVDARSKFTDRVYKLLSGCYGHIAHYDRGGFYAAQLEDNEDFRRNLRMLAAGKSVWGGRAYDGGHADLRDLVCAIIEVASAYEEDAGARLRSTVS